MNGAYYNELDPVAAQWLRNLIAAGHIAPGDVDERSIVEVTPDDLRGYTQCHFFAGIGVWSHALRSADWPDDRPVWTGSCPCQPFSAAGKGDEFADERHLWPVWFRLIRERRPVAVFGEQVASKDALSWLDHVSTDLEGEGYTFGAVDTCAAGFGAPHIRQRLYFVADPKRRSAERHRHEVGSQTGGVQGAPRQQRLRADVGNGVLACELAHAEQRGREGGRQRRAEPGTDQPTENRVQGACNGFWSDAEWVWCRDNVWRPHGPESFPLALVDGIAGRVGRVRAYGNGLCAAQAEEFVSAFLQLQPEYVGV